MTNKSSKKDTFDAVYLMMLALSVFIWPVIIYRTVDEMSSLVAFIVLIFLTADFYFRHKTQERKRQRYLALKKEEKELLAEIRMTRKR